MDKSRALTEIFVADKSIWGWSNKVGIYAKST